MKRASSKQRAAGFKTTLHRYGSPASDEDDPFGRGRVARMGSAMALPSEHLQHGRGPFRRPDQQADRGSRATLSESASSASEHEACQMDDVRRAFGIYERCDSISGFVLAN